MSPSLPRFLRRLSPWSRWTIRRRRKSMQAAIAGLPPFHQQAFALMRFENLSISQAAERLQCESSVVEAAFAEVLIALVRAAAP